MISDTLCEAIQEIEEYQKRLPEFYDGIKEDIEVVKDVMDSLRERLDEPAVEYTKSTFDGLTDEQRKQWRRTCEIHVRKWIRRLRLVEPISPDEIGELLRDKLAAGDHSC